MNRPNLTNLQCGVAQEAEATADSIGQKDNRLKGMGVQTRSGRKIKFPS